ASELCKDLVTTTQPPITTSGRTSRAALRCRASQATTTAFDIGDGKRGGRSRQHGFLAPSNSACSSTAQEGGSRAAEPVRVRLMEQAQGSCPQVVTRRCVIRPSYEVSDQVDRVPRGRMNSSDPSSHRWDLPVHAIERIAAVKRKITRWA